jgi:hypothetical protein
MTEAATIQLPVHRTNRFAPPIAERLPPAAWAKLQHLRELAADCAALQRSSNDALRAAREKREKLKIELAAATGPKIARKDEQASRLFERELREAEADFARKDEIMKMRSAANSELRTLLQRVEEFVARPIEGRFVAAKPAKLGKGHPLDQLSEVRKRIAETQASLHEAESAPVTAAEAKAAARLQIEALAAAGAPQVGALLDGAPFFNWPTEIQMINVQGIAKGGNIVGTGGTESVNTLALVAWLFREQLIAAIEAEIDPLADDSIALDPAARRARMNSLRSQLFELECLEEAIIEAAGPAARRRPDADVRAVLGIERTLT